jgi:hypothetical protein
LDRIQKGYQVMSTEKSAYEMLISGAPVRIVNDVRPQKNTLIPEEQALAESLVLIANRYGKFDEDGDGIWAGYYPPAENKVKDIGVKCANCVLYMGAGQCRIILQPVEPEGKCRFAVIPEGVVRVTMGGSTI